MLGSPELYETLLTGGTAIAKLLIFAGVAYGLLRVASRAAVWLGNSRPIRWVVYLQLFLVVIGLLLGATDGLLYGATGRTLTGMLADTVDTLTTLI